MLFIAQLLCALFLSRSVAMPFAIWDTSRCWANLGDNGGKWEEKAETGLGACPADPVLVSVSQCNIFHLGHLFRSAEDILSTGFFSISSSASACICICISICSYGCLCVCYLTKHSLNFSLLLLPLTWLTAHGRLLILGVVLEPPTAPPPSPYIHECI